MLDQRPIVGARQDVLEHDVICEQNVGRIGLNPVTLLIPLLPGVTRKGNRRLGETVAQKLFQLTKL